jgi:hypothetical protein
MMKPARPAHAKEKTTQEQLGQTLGRTEEKLPKQVHLSCTIRLLLFLTDAFILAAEDMAGWESNKRDVMSGTFSAVPESLVPAAYARAENIRFKAPQIANCGCT